MHSFSASTTMARTCCRCLPCVLRAYKSKAPAAPSAADWPLMPKPARVAVASCSCSAFSPAATSKCQSGTSVVLLPARLTSKASLCKSTKISAGAIRSSSCFKRIGRDAASLLISVTQKRPLASDSQASPSLQVLRWVSTHKASNGRSDFSGSSSASVSVPGVMTRCTLRSTGPLLVAGSPICSQMATDSPSLTSLARYCSAE